MEDKGETQYPLSTKLGERNREEGAREEIVEIDKA